MTLKRGNRVQEIRNPKRTGVIVKITEGNSVEDHGTVAVWLETEVEYGIDNCEHYCHFGWEKTIRVIEE